MRRILVLSFMLMVIFGCGRRQASEAPAPLPSSRIRASTPVPKPPEKRVAMRVRAETWRKDQRPFDIGADLRERLGKVGVEVMPEGTKEVDGILLVELSETPYGDYMFAGKGTMLNFTLSLLDGRTARSLGQLKGLADTPFSVSGGKSLYEAALEELRQDHLYGNAHHLLAALLGLRSAYRPALQAAIWPRVGEQALPLLKRTGFKPANPEEEALLAIAEGRYEASIRYGKAALSPLTTLLEGWHWPEVSTQVAKALGDLGDPSAAKVLLKRFRGSVHSANSDEDKRMVLALLEALGKVGDAYALADLDQVAQDKASAFSRPAAQAAKRIRGRLDAGSQ